MLTDKELYEGFSEEKIEEMKDRARNGGEKPGDESHRRVAPWERSASRGSKPTGSWKRSSRLVRAGNARTRPRPGYLRRWEAHIGNFYETTRRSWPGWAGCTRARGFPESVRSHGPGWRNIYGTPWPRTRAAREAPGFPARPRGKKPRRRAAGSFPRIGKFDGTEPPSICLTTTLQGAEGGTERFRSDGQTERRRGVRFRRAPGQTRAHREHRQQVRLYAPIRGPGGASPRIRPPGPGGGRISLRPIRPSGTRGRRGDRRFLRKKLRRHLPLMAKTYVNGPGPSRIRLAQGRHRRPGIGHKMELHEIPRFQGRPAGRRYAPSAEPRTLAADIEKALEA